jgi:hypothetical protein
MDDKTRELITRLFIADVDAAGEYADTEVCGAVSDLRKHLEATKQWFWSVDAEPMLEWVILCKRTNEPKLSWIESQLDDLGIPNRRDGESFHAPILTVPKNFEVRAHLNVLGAPAPARYRRWYKTIDDMPDEHRHFAGGRENDND